MRPSHNSSDENYDEKSCSDQINGLYYKHMTIVNYASSVVNKLKALDTDDARVVIYDRHVFIVHTTSLFLKIILEKTEHYNYLQ